MPESTTTIMTLPTLKVMGFLSRKKRQITPTPTTTSAEVVQAQPSTPTHTRHPLLSLLLPFKRPRQPARDAGKRLFTADILVVIFEYLDRRSLARCARVNRLCFELHGRFLYRIVDIDAKWVQRNEKRRRGRDVLARIGSSYLPARWVYRMAGGSIREPLLPAQLESNLLHIQHLTILSHPRPHFQHLFDDSDTFPSLDTLTIINVAEMARYHHPEAIPLVDAIQWMFGFLPKHIRVMHITDARNEPHPIGLCEVLGIEKVTFQFNQDYCRRILSKKTYNEWGCNAVSFCPDLRQLDLVFCSSSLGPSATRKTVDIDDGGMMYILGNLADIMIASWPLSDVSVRFVGFFEMLANFTVDGKVLKDYEQQGWLLVAVELMGGHYDYGRDEAGQRWEKLEYLTMEEYWAEGNLAF